MSTIVRVENDLVELTPEGCKTDNFMLGVLCRFKMGTGAGGFHGGPNPHKAAAEKLVAALKEDGIDAEIISVEQ